MWTKRNDVCRYALSGQKANAMDLITSITNGIPVCGIDEEGNCKLRRKVNEIDLITLPSPMVSAYVALY